MAEITGDERFANRFFDSYINGQELPDYESLLSNAGLLLRKSNAGNATLGQVSLDFEGKSALIANNTIIGSPLYMAGADRGDQIVYVAADSTAERRVVEPGFQDDENMEIIEGVSVGERIVVKGQRSLKHGAAIKILEGDSAAAPGEQAGP